MDQMHDAEKLLVGTKGAEYAHDQDQLANFKRLGNILGIKAGLICLVYFHKHLDGIISYIQEGKEISDEAISGRFRDARNYLALLECLLSEKVQDHENCVRCNMTWPHHSLTCTTHAKQTRRE